MSIALMTEAWKAELPSGRKFVLLSLCDNANDGICKQIRFNPHIFQPCNSTCSTVCMQCTYYQMSCN